MQLNNKLGLSSWLLYNLSLVIQWEKETTDPTTGRAGGTAETHERTLLSLRQRRPLRLLDVEESSVRELLLQVAGPHAGDARLVHTARLPHLLHACRQHVHHGVHSEK